MVCSKCEKKLSRSVNPDTWKSGSRSVSPLICTPDILEEISNCSCMQNSSSSQQKQGSVSSFQNVATGASGRDADGGTTTSEDLTPRSKQLDEIWKQAEMALSMSASSVGAPAKAVSSSAPARTRPQFDSNIHIPTFPAFPKTGQASRQGSNQKSDGPSGSGYFSKTSSLADVSGNEFLTDHDRTKFGNMKTVMSTDSFSRPPIAFGGINIGGNSGNAAGAGGATSSKQGEKRKSEDKPETVLLRVKRRRGEEVLPCMVVPDPKRRHISVFRHIDSLPEAAAGFAAELASTRARVPKFAPTLIGDKVPPASTNDTTPTLTPPENSQKVCASGSHRSPLKNGGSQFTSDSAKDRRQQAFLQSQAASRAQKFKEVKRRRESGQGTNSAVEVIDIEQTSAIESANGGIQCNGMSMVVVEGQGRGEDEFEYDVYELDLDPEALMTVEEGEMDTGFVDLAQPWGNTQLRSDLWFEAPHRFSDEESEEEEGHDYPEESDDFDDGDIDYDSEY